MITPLYIVKLLALVALLLATFFGCQRIFANKTKFLDSIAGGFVIFLAVNELIALPFILLHGPFYAYFWVFLLANGLFFVWGVSQLFRDRKKYTSDLKKSLCLSVIPVLFVITGCVYITQAYARYDADDAYYVSLVQQSVNNNHLYSSDPATGDPSIPIKTDRLFEGWELIEAGVAKTFGLSALETAHRLVPILVVLISFMAHGLIFGLVLKNKNNRNLALFFLGLVFLLSGYSVYSQGTFLLTRSWQGKAMLAAVIIPILFYVFLRIWYSPKGLKPYLALSLVTIAALALNPVAIFIVGSSIGIYALTLFVLKRDTKTSAKILFSVAPLLLASVAMIAKELARSDTIAKNRGRIETGDITWLTSVEAFIKGSALYFLLILGALMLWFAKDKRVRNYSRIIIIFSLLYTALVLNPFLFSFLTKFIAATYWRLFWVIPITIVLPLAAVVLADAVKSRISAKGNLRSIATAGIYAVVACVLIVSGSWILNFKVEKNLTISKLPAHVEDTLEFMSTLPEGRVVAAESTAAYYHNFPTKQELLISRVIYFKGQCNIAQDSACREKLQLFEAANRGSLGANTNTAQLLDKYEVDYLVLDNKNRKNSPKNYNLLYENELYAAFAKQ